MSLANQRFGFPRRFYERLPPFLGRFVAKLRLNQDVHRALPSTSNRPPVNDLQRLVDRLDHASNAGALFDLNGFAP